MRVKTLPSSTAPSFVVYILIAGLSIIGMVATDLYMPSLPAISVYFHASPALAKLSVTVFLIGFGLSQLFYGPMSDRFGRRPIILFGLATFIVGTLMCMFAVNMNVLLVGRFIQGVGVSATVSLARVLLRDLFDGDRLAKVGSYFGMTITLTPALAPVIGGYIQHVWGFRGNFVTLLLLGVVMTIMIYCLLPETNLNRNHRATKPACFLKNYITLLTYKVFLKNIIYAGLCFAALVAYVTEIPFLLQGVLNFTPLAFGLLSFLMAIGLVFGNIINSYLVLRLNREVIVRSGFSLIVGSGVVMAWIGMIGYINTPVIVIPVFVAMLGAALVFPNALAGALTPFATMAGAAGAIYGASQISIGSIASGIIAGLHSQNQVDLAVFFAVLGGLGLLLSFCMIE